MARVKATGLANNSKGKTNKDPCYIMQGYERIDYCTRMLQAIVTRKRDIGPQNYFFFSGYLSGILLNSKPLQTWPFVKVSLRPTFLSLVCFCLINLWVFMVRLGLLNMPLVQDSPALGVAVGPKQSTSAV